MSTKETRRPPTVFLSFTTPNATPILLPTYGLYYDKRFAALITRDVQSIVYLIAYRLRTVFISSPISFGFVPAPKWHKIHMKIKNPVPA